MGKLEVAKRKINLQYLKLSKLPYKGNETRYKEQLVVGLLLMNPLELFNTELKDSDGKYRKYLDTVTAMSINDMFYKLTEEDLKNGLH